MRVMIVSDIHYEIEPHHGIDESGAFDWLAKKIKWAKPEFLVGLGDWGYAWAKPQWDEVVRLSNTSIIYGNHDNLELLRRLENIDGSWVLAHDGETREIAGLRFGLINGIVSETKRTKQGVPRKSVEEYVKVGASLSGIDVLCSHESPYLPDYGSLILQNSPGVMAVGEVIRKVGPRLALSGHLGGPYTIGKIWKTASLRVDFSPAEKHYAILDAESGMLRIYHDWEIVMELPNAV